MINILKCECPKYGKFKLATTADGQGEHNLIVHDSYSRCKAKNTRTLVFLSFFQPNVGTTFGDWREATPPSSGVEFTPVIMPREELSTLNNSIIIQTLKKMNSIWTSARLKIHKKCNFPDFSWILKQRERSHHWINGNESWRVGFNQSDNQSSNNNTIH